MIPTRSVNFGINKESRLFRFNYEYNHQYAPQDLKKIGERVVICLSTLSDESGNVLYQSPFCDANGNFLEPALSQFLEALGFNKEALSKIYSCLGNGNQSLGAQVFLQRLQTRKIIPLFSDKKTELEGLITVERIGFSKEGSPKFYLVFNAALAAGASSAFYQGFSPRGTERAITKRMDPVYYQNPLPPLAQSLSKELAVPKKTDEPEKWQDHIPRRCSRIMNFEQGLMAAQLGRSVNADMLKDFSPLERYKFYLSIFEGLNVIHKYGAHGDVHLGNIVMDENNLALFIDFEDLSDAHPDSKARDVWRAMELICMVEIKLPEKLRMLSPAFLGRFLQANASKKEGNLFDGLTPNPKYPLDRLVLAIGALNPAKRYTAAAVLMHFYPVNVRN